MDKSRFSLLLLDPNEIFFEDLSVYFYQFDQYNSTGENSGRENLGRLRICSKSLVFEPKDVVKPLIKMRFENCMSIEELKVSEKERLTSSHFNSGICVDCNRHVEMLEGNVIAPYTFRDVRKKFIFILNYGHTEQFLRRIGQLHRAASLPASEQNNMLQAIETAMQASKTFDRLWLQDLYEQVVLETTANKITPLVVNPGMVLLSSATLYFQSYNNIEPNNLLKINLPDIRSVTKRRFMLQHVGCEVEYHTHNGLQNLFLSFKKRSDREQFYSCLLSQPSLKLADLDRERMTLCWQNGLLSNYDYLLYLNSEADRTFNDLTQYPVFPWVLQDYTSTTINLLSFHSYRDLSKPVGALNPIKLQRLKERYEEMPENKFLYGSHYSAPGFVLFYLTRLYPHYMLCLNNGTFDKADRMFNSVADVWRNILNNMSDFKELVPEFYDPTNNGDFLCNKFGINFGYRSDNTKVGDVELPPWAEGPKDFVTKMREALESDYVSRNLHNWIDLIFGYKQTGDEAAKADNLFCDVCYEGVVDLCAISDYNKRHALEVQIMEFGQIPKQIFFQPHPKRTTFWVDRPVTSVSCADLVRRLVPSLTLVSHKDAVTAVTLTPDKKQAVSVGRDGLLKIHSVEGGRQERSAALAATPLSSLVAFLPTSVIVGSWDSNIIMYDVACGRVIDTMLGHEDAVTCVCWAAERRLLVTGSWDGWVRLWQTETFPPSEPIRPASDLVSQLDHDGRVTCLCVNRTNTQLASGTEDGEIFLWSLITFTVTQKITEHTNTVNCIKFSPDGKKLVSCGDDQTFRLFDLTCGGMQTFYKELDDQLKCLDWDGTMLLLGNSKGCVYTWDLISVTLTRQVKAHEGAVLCLALAEDGSILLSGGEDKKILIWKPNDDSDSTI
ncbi:protein FAN-like [Macrosteles quadrilineatus]|uniref:protein FAN-like n=1 Tax=Macrosteles quadrilineatus TaxID=74068 RepID=UPI0023E287B9|nr:protein FAN-like [Macrosteles quadrilineatus]